MNRTPGLSVRSTQSLALVAGARRRGAATSRAGRLALAARCETVLQHRPRRDRLVIMLLLVERLRPLEVAAALGLSLRHVERTAEQLLVELSRALGARAPGSRSRKAA